MTTELDALIGNWRHRAAHLSAVASDADNTAARIYCACAQELEALSQVLAATPVASTDPASKHGQWKHRRTQGVYEALGDASLQTDRPLSDMASVIVYKGQDGKLWARASDEFFDRFDKVPPQAASEPGASS